MTMCRSKAEGGRRCNGNHSVPVSPAQPGDSDQRESYHGTPWQGWDEYQQRADELNRRVFDGESVTDILTQEHAARQRALAEQIAREGW